MHTNTKSEERRLSGKVCVVVHSYGSRSDKYEYNFYIIDRDSSSLIGDEYPDTKPTIRFQGVVEQGEYPPVSFCALGPTLYMFEGDVLSCPGYGKFPGTFAGTFEMTPQILAGSNYVLEKENLVPIKAMHERKISPIAVPTPDGKRILVFSSEFYWGANRGFDDSFELYDVAKDTWTLLPRSPSASRYPLRPSGHDCRIEAYGFQTDSRFLIRLDGEGFVFDFETWRWKEYYFPLRVTRASGGVKGYFVEIGGFYLTPDSAYDVSDFEGFRLYPDPLSNFPDDDDYDDDDMLSPYIALLGHLDHGVYDMGVVQAQRISIPNKLHVILHMYCTETKKFETDVEMYKRDFRMYEVEGGESMPVRPSLNTTVTKTVKFMIDFDFHTYIIGQMYLFAI